MPDPVIRDNKLEKGDIYFFTGSNFLIMKVFPYRMKKKEDSISFTFVSIFNK